MPVFTSVTFLVKLFINKYQNSLLYMKQINFIRAVVIIYIIKLDLENKNILR